MTEGRDPPPLARPPPIITDEDDDANDDVAPWPSAFKGAFVVFAPPIDDFEDALSLPSERFTNRSRSSSFGPPPPPTTREEVGEVVGAAPKTIDDDPNGLATG